MYVKLVMCVSLLVSFHSQSFSQEEGEKTQPSAKAVFGAVRVTHYYLHEYVGRGHYTFTDEEGERFKELEERMERVSRQTEKGKGFTEDTDSAIRELHKDFLTFLKEVIKNIPLESFLPREDGYADVSPEEWLQQKNGYPDGTFRGDYGPSRGYSDLTAKFEKENLQRKLEEKDWEITAYKRVLSRQWWVNLFGIVLSVAILIISFVIYWKSGDVIQEMGKERTQSWTSEDYRRTFAKNAYFAVMITACVFAFVATGVFLLFCVFGILDVSQRVE